MILVMTFHRIFLTACFASVFLLAAGYAGARVVDPQNVLIRNVHLVAADAEAEELLVNILIRDNKLEVVSQDPIPAVQPFGTGNVDS